MLCTSTHRQIQTPNSASDQAGYKRTKEKTMSASPHKRRTLMLWIMEKFSPTHTLPPKEEADVRAALRNLDHVPLPPLEGIRREIRTKLAAEQPKTNPFRRWLLPGFALSSLVLLLINTVMLGLICFLSGCASLISPVHVLNSAATLPSHANPAVGWSYGHNGVTILRSDGSVTIEQPNTLTPNSYSSTNSSQPTNIITAAFSPNGRYLATSNTTTVSVEDRIDSQVIYTISVATPISMLTFSPDSIRLVGSDSKQVNVWDLSTQQLDATRDFTEHITAIATTSESNNVIVIGSSRGTVTFWDDQLRTQKQQIALAGRVNQLVVSPNSQYLAIGMDPPSVDLMRFIDNGTTEPYPLSRSPSTAAISAITFSPDSQRFATVSSTGAISVWNLSQQTKPPYVVHTDLNEPCVLMFAANACQIIVGNKTGTIAILDLPRPAATDSSKYLAAGKSLQRSPSHVNSKTTKQLHIVL